MAEEHHPKSASDALRSEAFADDQLIALLHDVRARANVAQEHEAAELEAALAHLEAEAASRDLKIDGETEPTPPSLALHHATRALREGDLSGFARFLSWLDVLGLWRVFRAARTHVRPEHQTEALSEIALHVDALCFGSRTAYRRRGWLRRSGLSDEEQREYLDQCLSTAFGLILLYGPAG